MTTTFAGHVLTGSHGSRPSASGVPEGTLYSCTTHDLVYQSDGVSTWSTWATLGSPIADITDIPTAETGTSKVLKPDGAGGVVWGTDATGGGGGSASHSYLGTNAIGGSFDSTGNRVWMKKVTAATDGYITSIGAYLKMDTGDHVPNFVVGLHEDSGGSPAKLLAYNSAPLGSVLLEAALGTPIARWFHSPLGLWVTSGDYWLTIKNGNTGAFFLAYDATGSDRYYSPGGEWLADAGSIYGITTSANDYSIRADFLAT